MAGLIDANTGNSGDVATAAPTVGGQNTPATTTTESPLAGATAGNFMEAPGAATGVVSSAAVLGMTIFAYWALP